MVVDLEAQMGERMAVEGVEKVVAVVVKRINTQDSKRFDFHRTCNHDSNNARITFYFRNIRNLHSSFQYNKNYRTNHPYLHFPMSKRYMKSVIYFQKFAEGDPLVLQRYSCYQRHPRR